ncbi:MAG: 6-carboxytetrahydropterin synthase [Victivallales bacterium]|nr:6-carboxytetrahydropterin synthase [bacterium]MDD7752584.1 6-carboxytetrahydropterin synthase [bacterium]MDY5695559.1 6-carboxytetrahydropterin synthase [Victivallales bacterium]
MFELDVIREFSSAHCLKGYCGNCSEKHGHNWSVQVFIRSEKLDEIGIAVDFKALKRELDALLGELDHKDLNSIPPFDKLNPTSENIAMYIYKRLSGKLNGNGVKVYRVRVGENASSGASYFED